MLVCLAVWCGVFLFLTPRVADLPLIGLLLVAIAVYFASYEPSWVTSDAIMLLFGMTLGKLTLALLTVGKQRLERGKVMIGLLALLAVSSWWQFDITNRPYPLALRWSGLWYDPDIYGILMSVGTLLAVGLLAATRASRSENQRLNVFLLVAVVMTSIGLFFSYSRGAWLGTAVGLLYLAKAYGRLRWKFVLPGIIAVTVVVWFLWNATPDSAPWYVKRMDLGRASAQHRVAAWEAGFKMMLDHPFGLGWDRTVKVYRESYSAPPLGAGAIATNDYLMLGTQVGWPGLVCFISYIAFRLRPFFLRIRSQGLEIGNQLACRAAIVAMLVEFWFDNGLFELATASVFWVLLELGSETEKLPKTEKVETALKSEITESENESACERAHCTI